MRALLSVAQRLIGLDELHLLLDVAAQHDVGAAAGHVGGDGDHLRPAGLGHDLGLLGMLLGVEHLVRQLGLVQQLEISSEFSIDVVPTSTGWPRSKQSRMSAMTASYFSRAVL
jgi:hypothetical protein